MVTENKFLLLLLLFNMSSLLNQLKIFTAKPINVHWGRLTFTSDILWNGSLSHICISKAIKCTMSNNFRRGLSLSINLTSCAHEKLHVHVCKRKFALDHVYVFVYWENFTRMRKCLHVHQFTYVSKFVLWWKRQELIHVLEVHFLVPRYWPEEHCPFCNDRRFQ